MAEMAEMAAMAAMAGTAAMAETVAMAATAETEKAEVEEAVLLHETKNATGAIQRRAMVSAGRRHLRRTADPVTGVLQVRRAGNTMMNRDLLKFMSRRRITQRVTTPALVLLLCHLRRPRLPARRNAARLKRWGHIRQTVLTRIVRTGTLRNIKNRVSVLPELNIA